VENVGFTELLQNLWQMLVSLGLVLVILLFLALRWSLLIAWVAWWLWGVNWRRAWPVLAVGAWVPVVLLIVTAALVWSRLSPSTCDCLGFMTVGNFWWQLGAVSLLAAMAIFCGWVQGVFGWAPEDVSFEPPDPDPTHGHEHPVGSLHGHDFAHADEPQ
jgi:hypothetical protein